MMTEVPESEDIAVIVEVTSHAKCQHSGELLEVWFPKEMMTWAEFVR